MLSLWISGWRDRRLYPLAGGSRGGAANSVRAVAGAGAVIFYDCRRWLRRLSSGVSVAATGLRRAGEGLCVVLSLWISGWRDRRLYPLAGGSRGGAANPVRAVAGAGAVIFYDCRRWLRRLSSGVSIAATGLRRAGEGLCVVLSLSDFRLARSSSLSIGGGSRGGAANPVRAVAGAGAVIFYDCRRWPRRLSSGVSIAATGLRRAGEGLCVVLSLGFPAGAIVVFIHWRGQPRWRGESGARRGRRRCCHFL